jgi:signal peptidase
MTKTRLLSIFAKLVLSVLLAVVVGPLAVLTIVPRAVHGSALTVLTGCMTPTIPVGSVVIIRPVDPGTLHVGDVITYQREPGKAEFITHRITAIHTDKKPVTLTTKGDANRGADITPVPVTAVRGRVLFHVPYLGTLRSAVSGGAIALPLAILGLVGYAVSQLLAARRDKKAAEPTGRPEPLVVSPVEGPALDVQMRVASFRTSEFVGLLPGTVAALLRMDLVDQGLETFTLAAARAPSDLDDLELALAPFLPLTMVRSGVVSVPAHDAGIIDLRGEPEVVASAAA